MREMSSRTRELLFLIPAALVGLLGAASVASARTDELQAGPVAIAGIVAALFVVMHIALRMRCPQADPYTLPLVGMLAAIGLIIVGKQAQNEIAASGGRQGGENRAKWGIILGWISIVISVLVVIVVSVTYST